MEYIDCKSLREVINEYELESDKIIDIVRHICDGLKQAHQADIVHSDIKPENIIVGKNIYPIRFLNEPGVVDCDYLGSG